MRFRNTLFAVVWSAAALLTGAPAPAEEWEVSVDQLAGALRDAQPGDRIIVRPGYLASRLWVSNVHGTAEAMIEVVAKDPNDRPVFESHTAASFTLFDCSYILVDGIIGQGAGSPTTAGNNIEFAYGSHMILRNSLSRDIYGSGNSDGVKFAQSDNILMYNCTVEDWGDGGSGVDGMVSNSNLYMRNTFTFPGLAPSAGANGIMPKGAAYHNGIYKNHFIDGSSRAVCFGGSGGATGPEVYDSVAMGNVIEAGEAPLAYVSSTTCQFAYNTIVNPEKYVMRILKESAVGAYENTFRRNLVQYGNVTVQNIGAGNDAGSFTYAENYWYKYTDPAHSIPTLAAPETDPAGGVDPQLDADCRPRYGPAKAYGAHAAAMEAAFGQYANWFQWAWDKAQEYEPDADAGGEYRIAPGLHINLDAAGSQAGTPSYNTHQTLTWQWDLDYDGVFDDASGQAVEISYDDLTGTGPGQLALGPGRYAIELKMSQTDEYGTIVDYHLGELVILDELIVGDADLDGCVGYLDLGALSTNYDQSGGWRDGDFNGDGVVDFLDLGKLATHYAVGCAGDFTPAGPPIGDGQVPEPAVALLLGTALPFLRRRRFKPPAPRTKAKDSESGLLP